MWKLIVKHPLSNEILCEFEGKSIQKLTELLHEEYPNNFITYNKLENIKCGRNNSLPFLTLQRI